ncbi:MAG: HD domain-containing protein [Nitrospinaceae bacterium]|nr:HD domain-containing protein [Nitrospinaceae bacterium]NIR53315.1 HD domain-containing protein [Nitrospinaceae bacterium]NIS83713.1 HD domain-containing protein [Nitrospinaceae bacterium]NIT80509.1 HD domain-containing protein [Nitrospinaceae bacterium]NIU42837.1 HD domain-containing protein [Nitrospinaceae bacterium]
MTDTDQIQFRPITRAFFQKEWQDGFDIFYAVPQDKNNQFLKFARFDPLDFARLEMILNEKQHETFYIKEQDLYNYYRFTVLKKLILGLGHDKPPAEVVRRVYPVATRILQDYLEIPASDTFLLLLNDIPGLLAEAVKHQNLPFGELFQIIQKDNRTHVHCVNVGMYCLNFGRELGMNSGELTEICLGGMLADIGKKFIPRDILFKESQLSNEDVRTIRRHPALGRRALSNLKHYSNTVLRMTGEHHENFDGTGYPLGFSGKQILPAARICKIMDVFNALTSRRPYSESLTAIQALTLMKNEMAGQFDPQLLTEFILFTAKEAAKRRS